MEFVLHPQAAGSVPKPEIQRPEQLENEEELSEAMSRLNLLSEIEVDETALTELLRSIEDKIRQKADETNIDDMIRAFVSWTRTESRHGPEPKSLEELFQSLAQRHRHMQVVYLQGLLYEAGRNDLCKNVQTLVEGRAASGTMRIPYINFGRHPDYVGDLPSGIRAIVIYMESSFKEIDMKLQKLLRQLAQLLGLPRRLVICRTITTGSGFWITVLVPLSAMEILRKEFHRSDIQTYLASIGITKIKFLQPQETDEGERGKGKKRKTPETTTEIKMEPSPGTSTETAQKRSKTEAETETETAAVKKPEWMSWTSGDILHHFSKNGHEKIGEKLKEITTSGKEMVRWNPEFLMKIGLKPDELDTVKAEMKNIGVFEASLSTKVMNDPVHKHMEFHPLCVKVIDTPEFQRLRNIKQLGFVYLVYPGAAHNRFEHSLGVGHLAQTLAQSLRQRQPELGITDEDVLCVTIAGLCHDLGHGPHSHLFEYFMKEAQPDRDWQHEDASVMMFDHLIENNNLKTSFQWYGIGEEKYLDFIRSQIKGKKITKEDIEKLGDKQFLLEIVANRRNGIDVDRWDFIARDCLMLGIPNSFDHHRFMKHARVIKYKEEWQICSRDKEAEDLYKMFQTLHFLNRRAYQHKTLQAIEVMLVDVLMLAEKSEAITYKGQKGKALRISECVDDPVAYTSLDDSVFSLIQLSLSGNEDIKKAQDLLNRIRSRNFYKLAGESIPSVEPVDQDDLKKLTAYPMSPDKVAVKEMKLDYGTEKQNPILQTHFYEKADPYTPMTIKREQVSLILPERLSEYIVRLYCKDADQDSISKAEGHFKEWLHPKGLQAKVSLRQK